MSETMPPVSHEKANCSFDCRNPRRELDDALKAKDAEIIKALAREISPSPWPCPLCGATCSTRIPDPRAQLDEALDALVGMVAAGCTVMMPVSDAGRLDSMCNGDQADAMRILARAGRLVIDSDDGANRVIGHWPEKKA